MSDTMIELTRPFPDRYIHGNPSGGGTYVKHHVVEQRLIKVLGYPPHFTLVEAIRGDVAGIPADPQGRSNRAREGRPALTNVIVGVVARMQVTIDGEDVIVDEAGDCEEPHNWTHDGGRLKDAMSDAYKRCAMRIGVGLHLWSQDEYFLHDQLVKANGQSQVETSGADHPTAPETSGDAGEAVGDSAVSGSAGPPPSEPERASPATPETSGGAAGDGHGAEGEPRTGSSPRETTSPAPSEKLATAAQVKKLNVLAIVIGAKTDEDRYRMASDALGREISSYKEITRAEAHDLIDRWDSSEPDTRLDSTDTGSDVGSGAGGEEVATSERKTSPVPDAYSNKPDDGHKHQAQSRRPGWVFCPLCGAAERLSDAMDSGNWEKPDA
jgi:hypothetical protein